MGCVLVAVGSIFAFGGAVLIVRSAIKPLDDEMPPIRKAFKESKVVWGMWHTGDRIRSGKLYKIRSTQKILLLEPSRNNPSFERVMKIAKHSFEEAIFEIKTLTRKATEMGIPVRWHTEYLGYALTIYDSEPIQQNQELKPVSEKAWISVQFLEPSIAREQRQKNMVRKTEETEEFNDYIETYERIWRTSRIPNPEEYELV